MEPEPMPETLQLQISDYIAERIGLHFPRARWIDLQRGLASAMSELGFSDLRTGAEWLLSTPLSKTELDVLASHLTIGETYFFREKRTFEVLRGRILPQLIHARRNNDRRLRIWSAGCCTGEEPYSLAIVLHELIPDLADWHITILATDINVGFLKKAMAGAYREWAFRETPGWIKARYFKRDADGSYAILPEIKRLVTFVQLNLVEDAFPSLVIETNAMDLIFCRNVLMYFSPAQTRKVVSNLHRALVDEGWLIVSPSETSQALFKEFVTVNFPGAILYRRFDTRFREHTTSPTTTLEDFVTCLSNGHDFVALPEPVSCAVPEPSALSPTYEPVPVNPESGCYEDALSFYQQGQYENAVQVLLALAKTRLAPDAKIFSLLARALADQGKLTDALLWCDRWIETHKLDPLAHYLRAIVLQELGDSEQARRSLQKSIYLSPGFVPAHFASGNLARAVGKPAAARKHFATALSLLRNYKTNEVVPESDGLTAGRLAEIITAIAD